jgi:hypothetical protein
VYISASRRVKGSKPGVSSVGPLLETAPGVYIPLVRCSILLVRPSGNSNFTFPHLSIIQSFLFRAKFHTVVNSLNFFIFHNFYDFKKSENLRKIKK